MCSNIPAGAVMDPNMVNPDQSMYQHLKAVSTFAKTLLSFTTTSEVYRALAIQKVVIVSVTLVATQTEVALKD